MLVMGRTKKGGDLRIAKIVRYESREMRISRTVVHQGHNQEWHQTTLNVVHEIAVAHEFLALTTDLTLATSNIALGNQRWLHLSEVIAEVLDNSTGLGQNQGLGRAWGLDGDDWRFAQLVDFLQLSGSKFIGAALEGLQIIFQLQFLEEPEDTVTSRLLEPGQVSTCISKLGFSIIFSHCHIPVKSDFAALVIIRHFVRLDVQNQGKVYGIECKIDAEKEPLFELEVSLNSRLNDVNRPRHGCSLEQD